MHCLTGRALVRADRKTATFSAVVLTLCARPEGRLLKMRILVSILLPISQMPNEKWDVSFPKSDFSLLKSHISLLNSHFSLLKSHIPLLTS